MLYSGCYLLKCDKYPLKSPFNFPSVMVGFVTWLLDSVTTDSVFYNWFRARACCLAGGRFYHACACEVPLIFVFDNTVVAVGVREGYAISASCFEEAYCNNAYGENGWCPLKYSERLRVLWVLVTLITVGKATQHMAKCHWVLWTFTMSCAFAKTLKEREKSCCPFGPTNTDRINVTTHKAP